VIREVRSVTVREITVGVVAPAYVNVPLWVAQHHGFFEGEGLHAVSRVIGTTEGTTRAVRDGDVDVALGSPEGSIADAAAGGPLRVAAGLIDRPPLSLIALSRHRTVQDLRGGLIGTSSLKEGTRHVAERMLAAHGLTYPADYEWALEGSHVERWKALQAGTIDAALQMIPYDYIAEEAGFSNLGAVTEDFAFNAVCVRRDVDREMLTRFLRAMSQAIAWFRGNVAAAAAIAATETSAAERHALRACQALAADGVIPAGLRTGEAAFDAAVESLRLSGGLPAGHGDPRAALDYSCLDLALNETHGGTGA
jgi:ABC-type nitrate/sulfonate/bicarbonate transport system substrate-binding protein